MAFDFPASPTLNQVFTAPGGAPSYKWDGEKWGSQLGSSVYPDASAQGQMLARVSAAAGPFEQFNIPGLSSLVPGATDLVLGVPVAGGAPRKVAAGDIASLLSLAAYAPLASPTFTGDPKAPTATVGDNDTSIATTAFVAAAVSTLPPAAAIIPQGRLTLTTNTPIMKASASAQTTIRYTPYSGLYVPIWNGTIWTATSIVAELTQTTTDTTKSPAACAANSIYDMFVWNDAGTIRCTRGPAWTNDTTRSAGTALTRSIGGILTNAVAITNGPAISRGTYVGSIRTNASSQVDWTFGTAGTGAGIMGTLNVFNEYNRQNVSTASHDTTSNYTYGTAAWRNANANAGWRINFLMGTDEEACHATYASTVFSNSSGPIYGGIAVSLDGASPTTQQGSTGGWVAGGTAVNGNVMMTSTFHSVPLLGAHYVQAFEYAQGSVGFGSNAGMAGSQAGLIWNGRL